MTVLLFFDFSGGEIMLVIFAVFVLFGPKKVPEIARQIGRGMNELRKVTNDLSREFKEGADEIKQQVDNVKSDIMSGAAKVTDELKSGAEELSRATQTFNKDVYNIPETEAASTSVPVEDSTVKGLQHDINVEKKEPEPDKPAG